jgi:propionyl-CoA carboxylase alpha chain
VSIPPVGGICVDNGFYGYPDLLWSNACKLITYERREEGIQIMLKAIDGYLVKGVETTFQFATVFEHEACLPEFWHPLSWKNT